MTRYALRLFNGLITFAVSLALVVAGLYAGYALWDNRQIYSAAESTQLEMLRFKPKAISADGEMVEGPSFDELLAINPDVCAWISMDGTAIDFPVLQGETNLTYINTDAFGNFALAGSIFLDHRCSREFDGPYNLLYGHHMSNHGMFGDLDLYKDEQFFSENASGQLMLPGEVHELRVLACLVTEASDDVLFEPELWQEDIGALVEYCGENALSVREDTVEMLEAQRARFAAGEGSAPRIVSLSTCSSEYTNARTIVLALMDPS